MSKLQKLGYLKKEWENLDICNAFLDGKLSVSVDDETFHCP